MVEGGCEHLHVTMRRLYISTRVVVREQHNGDGRDERTVVNSQSKAENVDSSGLRLP